MERLRFVFLTFIIIILIIYGLFARNDTFSALNYYHENNVKEQTSHFFRKYEEDKVNCSTKVFYDRQKLQSYLRKGIHMINPCTFNHFNSYLLDKRQFIGGVWFTPKDSPSRKAQLYPTRCKFTNILQDGSLLKQCLLSRNISKILVTGDSNGRKLTQNMIKLFEEISRNKCKQTGYQNKINEAKYFAASKVPVSNLQINSCGFRSSSCASWKYQCRVGSSTRNSTVQMVTVEYIAMLHIIDATTRLFYDHAGEFSRRLMNAENKLEYILKYYLPSKGYPNLWIVTPPFHHETWTHSMQHMKIHISYLFSLMEIYVPEKTKVVFMADARECGEKRPRKIGTSFTEAWNISRNEKIDRMNQIWYELLADKLKTAKNWNAFLDATKITCPLMCTWHSDGAHLVPVWYEMMSGYILDTLCNS